MPWRHVEGGSSAATAVPYDDSGDHGSNDSGSGGGNSHSGSGNSHSSGGNSGG
jgi:hypothetical protein